MSLKEEMWKYEQITGESAEHVPIIKLGAFLDGYEMGLKALEQQPCEDCISRERLLARIDEERKHLLDLKMDGAEHIIVHHARRIIEDMPSVTPQPKRGKWIEQNDTSKHHYGWYYCSECGAYIMSKCNYCSECGSYNGGEDE